MRKKKNIYSVNTLHIWLYVTYIIGLMFTSITEFWYYMLIGSYILSGVAIRYTGRCPLVILARFGFLKFFKASRLIYKDKFVAALIIYSIYPSVLLSTILTKIIG